VVATCEKKKMALEKTWQFAGAISLLQFGRRSL
jgi:hypothetical protein